MGNDDKINEGLLEKSKSLFLPKEIEDKEGAGIKTYILEDEYKKTSRNFSYKAYLILLIFLAVQALFTFVTVLYINYRDAQTEVNISEFSGGELKEILSAQRNEEEQLRKARKDLELLKKKLLEEIQLVKKNSGEMREAIQKKDISDSQKTQEIAGVNDREKEKIRSLQKEYDERIKEKETKIAALEVSVKNARTRVEENVLKADKLLSNSERLMQMKLQKQQDHYQELMARIVLKYNPNFTGSDVRSVLATELKDVKNAELLPYESDMKKDGGMSVSGYDELKKSRNGFDLLMKEMQKIPYKNSVDPALDRMDMFHKSLLAYYDIYSKNLLDSNRIKRSILNSYDYAFEDLTRKSPETGYIVDSRNTESITVYVNAVVRIKSGLRAKVFRRDDEQIAEIEFVDENRKAKLISINPGKSIRPFDRVLIDFKR